MGNKSGNTIYNDDGTTTTQSGDFFYNSDGTTITRSGDFFYKSDGTTITKSGDFFYNSDGTTITKSGDTYYKSDGTTITKSGDFLYGASSADSFLFGDSDEETNSNNSFTSDINSGSDTTSFSDIDFSNMTPQGALISLITLAIFAAVFYFIQIDKNPNVIKDISEYVVKFFQGLYNTYLAK